MYPDGMDPEFAEEVAVASLTASLVRATGRQPPLPSFCSPAVLAYRRLLRAYEGPNPCGVCLNQIPQTGDAQLSVADIRSSELGEGRAVAASKLLSPSKMSEYRPAGVSGSDNTKHFAELISRLIGIH